MANGLSSFQRVKSIITIHKSINHFFIVHPYPQFIVIAAIFKFIQVWCGLTHHFHDNLELDLLHLFQNVLQMCVYVRAHLLLLKHKYIQIQTLKCRDLKIIVIQFDLWFCVCVSKCVFCVNLAVYLWQIASM